MALAARSTAAAVARCVASACRRQGPQTTDAASSSGGSGAASATDAGEGAVCSQRCCLHDVPGAVAEEVADVLLACGAQAASIEEFRAPGAPEQEIFADTPPSSSGAWPTDGGPDASAARVWDRCTVVAHLPPEADAEALLGSVADDFQLGHLQRSVALVCEGLWIQPSWSNPPTSDPSATAILLEPGLAFGTGDHPTTRLCLRWLRHLALGGQLHGANVMDYGTGSGVLAISALLLGANAAVGTDIDPLAIKAAGQNAALNGVADRLRLAVCSPSGEVQRQGEQQQGSVDMAHEQQQQQEYDGPLVQLAPLLAGHTRPGGLLGLSGVLEEQADAVVEAYSPWFEGFEVEAEDRWALVTAVRKRA
eukprot:scaffold12.g8284.t1